MVDASSEVIINVTLEEDAWKDSFDKLLDTKPVLREQNMLKKEVRASFNMNSSVENCSTHSSKDFLQVASPHIRLHVQKKVEAGNLSIDKERCSSISTPVGKHLISNPFKCSLSPISAWKLRYCDRSDVEKDIGHLPNTNAIEINVENRCSKNNEHSNIIEDSIINTGVVIVGSRKSIFFKPNPDSDLSETTFNICSKSVWKERVLKRCKQTVVVDFSEAYKAEEMTDCKKIGEGAYGEVFITGCVNPSQNTVLKIIPIEGKDLINGEVQKSYEQILPEIVISVELSNLKDSRHQINSTSGYVEIKKVACVKGKYPAHLLKLWEVYDNEKGSENDNPDILPSDQHYIVLELAYCGKDLEGFVFNNAEQSYYALQQIILTLAVGEESFCFEHRDLHWGNILVINTAEKHINYKLQENTLTLPTKGVKITIIDYTLSRMSYEDCCLYNDLSYDEELFSAMGDYQFDIYRMMRDILKNKWETFEPKTNVFWLSYLTKKMIQGVNYKNTRTKTHATFLSKLKQIDTIILDFRSAADCAKYFKKL